MKPVPVALARRVWGKERFKEEDTNRISLNVTTPREATLVNVPVSSVAERDVSLDIELNTIDVELSLVQTLPVEFLRVTVKE